MSWQRRILIVDLNRSKVAIEPLNMEWANAYLGERGLASKYLCERMSPQTDPLAPENVLIFATGPLTGTMSSTSGRYAVVTKGPLTGAIACSNSGGKFGAELKFAGFDLLILEDRAPEPVYIHIVDNDVQILPARHLWGQSVWHTEERIRTDHQDPSLKIASIGKAGESQVRFACVVNDLHRAAGRSGVGAVMGSKNLKAIAVRGSVGVRVQDPTAFMRSVRHTHQLLAQSAGRKRMTTHGTSAMMTTMNNFGGLPTRNFREVTFEGVNHINHEAMRKPKANGHVNLITNKACFGCTIACGRISHIDKEHFTIVNRKEYWHASGGLEYETAFAFGPLLGIDDIDALTFAGYLMNEHGMDPISFGGTLAAAMELFELGVIDESVTDGISLRFGNAQALTLMAEKTGKFEGFGRELGLGSRLLCEKYGRPELAMAVKGQEFAGYDGRAMQGMGLGYATSNRGACHLRHDTFEADTESTEWHGKAEPCKISQDKTAMIDSTGLCLFTTSGWDVEEFRIQLNAATGNHWSREDLLAIGERIWNLERTFNLGSGLSRKDDTLPPRMLNDTLSEGLAKGHTCELEPMLDEYYQLRGWDAQGVPTPATLARLNLKQ